MSEEANTNELRIAIKGEILQSNFDEFCAELKAQIAGLNKKLLTDADFEVAANNVKALKQAENSLKSAKEQALRQAEDVQKLFAAIDDVSNEARTARLGLERQIKDMKSELRLDIIKSGLRDLDDSDIHFGRERIEACVKGKKSFDLMQGAVSEEVAQIKAEVQAARDVLKAFAEKHGKSMLPDVKQLEQMQVEPLRKELELRLERAEIEAERKKAEAAIAEAKRIEAEKAEKERVEAERKEAEAAIAEAKRIEAEKAEKERVEAERKENSPEPKQTPETPVAAPEAAPKPAHPAGEQIKWEMDEFKNLVAAQFAPVRKFREQMQYAENKQRALQFSRQVTDAFQRLDSGGGAK